MNRILAAQTKQGMVRTASLLALAISASAFGWSASGTVKSASGPLTGAAVTVQDSAAIKGVTTDATGAFTIGTTGIEGSIQRHEFQAQVIGQELLVQSPKDGPFEIALVDASGRSVWSSRTDARQGTAKISLPTGLRSGAIFLRVRHSQGVQYLAVPGDGDAHLDNGVVTVGILRQNPGGSVDA